MSGFDYSAAAELYPSKGRNESPKARYRRFATAAEAVQYAVEEMPQALLRGSFLEVDEQRFDGAQILDLYSAETYPLVRAPAD
ncbi:hypothetical protein N8A98_13475 [Devosia neptuniae]|uniref:Uncharacterized protein n=1 Tax=Devosia neptuniae TaxID=191302 RepID=A0ABY6C822_9HYPH|nr:hypothetical protein [Devosia neptuniae]UXN68282.1 hypothetical protein N8A98_13475 [Devosia neptuniae]